MPRTDASILTLAVAASWPGRPPSDLARLDPTDIRRLVKAAERLGTAPAVVSNLLDAGHAPALTAAELGLHDATLFTNLIALDAAETLLAAFAAEGVRAVPLKGTAILLDLWPGRPAARAMHDVDLLLDTEDFRAVTANLEALGWRRDRGTPLADGLSPEARFLLDVGPGAQLVELHRTLVFPGRHAIDTRALFERTHGEGARRRLDPADHLVYLAVHKAMHGYLNDARDLIDGAAWIDAGTGEEPPGTPLRWEAVVERAVEWRARAVTWLFLTRVASSFGVPVPPAVLDALRPSAARRVALQRAMPDITTEPAMQPLKNEARPLLPKALAALLANDSPGLELAVLALIVGRRLGDHGLARLRLATAARPWADRLSLRPLERVARRR